MFILLLVAMKILFIFKNVSLKMFFCVYILKMEAFFLIVLTVNIVMLVHFSALFY